MKTIDIVKLMVLGGVGILSTILASRLMARDLLEQQDVPAAVATKHRIGGDEAAGGLEGRIPVTSLAEFHMDGASVTGGLGRFDVEAQATMMESRDEASYMWTLIVQDESGTETLRQVDYDTQIFSLEAKGVPIEKNFRDGFNFPPGIYNVELRLYEVTGVEDPSILAGEGAPGPHILLSYADKVTID